MNTTTVKIPGPNSTFEITTDTVSINGADLTKNAIRTVQIGKPLPLFAILKDECNYWVRINPESDDCIEFNIPPSTIGAAATKAFNKIIKHLEDSILPQIHNNAKQAFLNGETISFTAQLTEMEIEGKIPAASVSMNKAGLTLPVIGSGLTRTGETRTIPWSDAKIKCIPFVMPGLINISSIKDSKLRCSFDWRQVPNGWMIQDFFKWASEHAGR